MIKSPLEFLRQRSLFQKLSYLIYAFYLAVYIFEIVYVLRIADAANRMGPL